jgi:ABC-2 type transport system permease protein
MFDSVAMTGAVARWELRCFFQRPSTYVLLLASALAGGWSFSWLLTLLARGGGVGRPHADDPLVQFLGPNVFLVGFCTLLVPLLTMNFVADERRRGTWELLMTSPVSRGQAIVGKFLAGWIMLLVTLSPWPYFLMTLRIWNGRTRMLWEVVPWFDGPAAPFDFGPVWSGIAGLATIGGTLIAMGLLASSICRRPVSASLLMLVAMLTLLLLGALPRALEFWEFPRGRYAWIDNISCWGHLARFSRGTIVPRIVIGHLLAVTGMLILATRGSCRLDDN